MSGRTRTRIAPPGRLTGGRGVAEADDEVTRFAETVQVGERQILDIVRQQVVRERFPQAGTTLRSDASPARHPDSCAGFPSVVVLTVDVSVIGLSQAIVAAVRQEGWMLGAAAGGADGNDPLVTFGILEASMRRAQGVPEHMFPRLIDIYREAFLEVVRRAPIDWPAARLYSSTIEHLFADVEAGAAARSSLPRVVQALGADDRVPASGSHSSDHGDIAVVMLDVDGGLEHANNAAARLFGIEFTPASLRARSGVSLGHLAGLALEITAFLSGQASQFLLVWPLLTTVGTRELRIHFKRRYTGAGGPAGAIIACSDLSPMAVLAA